MGTVWSSDVVVPVSPLSSLAWEPEVVDILDGTRRVRTSRQATVFLAGCLPRRPRSGLVPGAARDALKCSRASAKPGPRAC